MATGMLECFSSLDFQRSQLVTGLKLSYLWNSCGVPTSKTVLELCFVVNLPIIDVISRFTSIGHFLEKMQFGSVNFHDPTLCTSEYSLIH